MTREILLSCTLCNGSEIQANDIFNKDIVPNGQLRYYGHGTYFEVKMPSQDAFLAAAEDSAYIKILEIDYENNLVSGEYHFVGIHNSNGSEFLITDGTFSNVSFD